MSRAPEPTWTEQVNAGIAALRITRALCRLQSARLDRLAVTDDAMRRLTLDALADTTTGPAPTDDETALLTDLSALLADPALPQGPLRMTEEGHLR